MNIRALCNNVTDGTDERQIDSCRHQKREESRRISLYQGDHSPRSQKHPQQYEMPEDLAKKM